MKKIEATIQPFTLDDVRDALVESGIRGMTVTEVKGLNPRKHAAWYRGSEYVIWFAPQYKIEIVVPDDEIERCIGAISRSARAADGDCGEIVVLPVEEAIRVRTGERLVRIARAA